MNDSERRTITKAAREVPCAVGTIANYARARAIPFEVVGGIRFFTDESIKAARKLYAKGKRHAGGRAA